MIITAADSNYLPGVMLLAEFFYRHKQPAGLRVYNLGFDATELVEKFPQVDVVDFGMQEEREGWQRLAKPGIILEELRRDGKALWIDADCVPNTSLRLPWEQTTQRPFFVNQGNYALVGSNNVDKLASAGIQTKHWSSMKVPSPALIGLSVTEDRDDRKFAKRWKELCDDYAEGWFNYEHGPFIHMVASYKYPILWDGAKWNIMGGVVGKTIEETIANLPRGVRHFAGTAKPWLNWQNQEISGGKISVYEAIETVKQALRHQEEQAKEQQRLRQKKVEHKETMPAIVPERPQLTQGVGSYLEEWFKVKPCWRCTESLDKMNELGPNGCTEKFDSLVAEVMQNAKLKSTITSLLTKIPGANSAVGYALQKSIESEIERLHSDTVIITPHYNPCKFRRLRETYYEWIPTLGVHRDIVKPIELVFDDDEPEIEGSHVVRGTRENNLMWQKEALLNLAASRLPDHIRFIVFSDHDIIFGEPNWLGKARHLIEYNKCNAVQLFAEIELLAADGSVERKSHWAPGGAWMIDRQWFDRVGGLFSRDIAGGGDNTFACAVGRLPSRTANCTAPKLSKANMDYIAKCKGSKFGNLGSAAKHINHGERRNRKYIERYDILKDNDLDPNADVRLNADGILEWSSDKPDMHRRMMEYFEARQEDSALHKESSNG